MKHQSNPLIGKARTLRKNQTHAEQHFWYHVRSRRLEGMRFRRQVPLGCYIVDFYCPSANLVIELDGGHHDTEAIEKYDSARTSYLAGQGLKVIRFWNNEVLENIGGVLDRVLGEVQSLRPHPQPSPAKREKE